MCECSSFFVFPRLLLLGLIVVRFVVQQVISEYLGYGFGSHNYSEDGGHQVRDRELPRQGQLLPLIEENEGFPYTVRYSQGFVRKNEKA